jgi:hypothetical protein
MENKRGQFYLVAAIIIVLALSTLASVATYAVVKPKPRSVTDLGSELSEEGARIVEYGIMNADDKVEEFASEVYAPYFLRKTENANVVFIYGNKNNLKAIQYYTSSTGSISANIGSGSTSWAILNDFANQTAITGITEDVVRVTMFGTEYEFELRDNEMFYFLIIQEKEGEVYVEKNE